MLLRHGAFASGALQAAGGVGGEAEHPGTRSLVFCCSIEHARFATHWLRERSVGERNVRVDAVFAGPGSADRSDCLDRLARGELDALCVVDMFNEGVDVPAVDRVVMLRPTESPIVFLQQLGRGLRNHEGKHQLTVIDFVGNHRIFLARIRRLLSLVSSLATDVQRSLEQVVRMTARGSGRRPYSPGACRRSLPYVFAAPRIDAPDGARITRA